MMVMMWPVIPTLDLERVISIRFHDRSSFRCCKPMALEYTIAHNADREDIPPIKKYIVRLISSALYLAAFAEMPAPITLGRSSCPIENNSPTPHATAATRKIVMTISRKKGPLTSFF